MAMVHDPHATLVRSLRFFNDNRGMSIGKYIKEIGRGKDGAK